jgi:class 3 adenylate cyclase
MTPIPRGAVTFLFSDVEGSTRLLESHPADAGPALARHHELLADAMHAHSGVLAWIERALVSHE